ncbi:hypothetical protein BT96DRAFT_947143 [Gymnopus androsaceus JB14]|uniref:Uncharacterized protein n=1 Tax=Gymnopus androsaceus JB14 TaxID=1447944 RepID=A0A6A4GTE3_9AGAR|nr:hypothetical protein BT96DRAFT_947143 [Gymnopus androsaceus JB14]
MSLVGTFGSRESTTPSGSLIPLGSVARSSATSSSLSSAVQTKLSEMESLDVTLHDWIAPPPPKPKAPPKKKQKLGITVDDVAPYLSCIAVEAWLGQCEVVHQQAMACYAGSSGRTKMLTQLKSVLKDSCSVGIQIDADNIVSVPALWNGAKVNLNTSGQIDPSIVWQVIWELYEIKFCLEMLVLDRYMVPEPQGDTDEVEMLKEAWYEREFQVHHCWPGLPYLPKYTDPGFSSQHGTYHICHLKGLFDLVKAWLGVKPPELWRPFPQEDDHTALMEIEEILVNYYLCVFLKTFHWPSTVPHVAL